MNDISLLNFGRDIQHALMPLSKADLIKRSHLLVANTAVSEHVCRRDTLGEIESHVANDGCVAVHTLVRGEIPADHNWMYLLPVHCAFTQTAAWMR